MHANHIDASPSSFRWDVSTRPKGLHSFFSLAVGSSGFSNIEARLFTKNLFMLSEGSEFLLLFRMAHIFSTLTIPTNTFHQYFFGFVFPFFFLNTQHEVYDILQDLDEYFLFISKDYWSSMLQHQLHLKEERHHLPDQLLFFYRDFLKISLQSMIMFDF